MTTGINLYRLRTGVMSSKEWNCVTARAKTLAKAAVWIDDKSILSVGDLRQRAYELVTMYGVTFIFLKLSSTCYTKQNKGSFCERLRDGSTFLIKSGQQRGSITSLRFILL